MDLELELFGDLKDKSGCSTALGKVYMLSLSSQPVDHEDASGERQKVSQQKIVELKPSKIELLWDNTVFCFLSIRNSKWILLHFLRWLIAENSEEKNHYYIVYGWGFNF